MFRYPFIFKTLESLEAQEQYMARAQRALYSLRERIRDVLELAAERAALIKEFWRAPTGRSAVCARRRLKISALNVK